MPSSIFDKVTRDQISNFREIEKFSACHKFTSQKALTEANFTRVFLVHLRTEWHVVSVFRSNVCDKHDILEGNNVIVTGKMARGRAGSVALIDTGNGKEAL